MKSVALLFALIVWSVHSLATTNTAILDSDIPLTIFKNADDSQGQEVLTTTYLRKAIHANAFCRGANPPHGSFIRAESGIAIQLDCAPQYSFIECSASEKTNCLILNQTGIPASVISKTMQSLRKTKANDLLSVVGMTSAEWTASLANTRVFMFNHGADLKDLMNLKPVTKFEVITMSVNGNAAKIFQQILYYGAEINASERTKKAMSSESKTQEAKTVEKKN